MAYIVQNTIVTKAKSFSAGDELSAEDVKIIGDDLERFVELGAIAEVGTKKEKEKNMNSQFVNELAIHIKRNCAIFLKEILFSLSILFPCFFHCL